MQRQSIQIRQQHVKPSDRLNLAGALLTPSASLSDNFKHSLTLFSKFFSSFPHGTCSLSVSCQYSALDGVYHQFWAAFPSNPTHAKAYRVRSALPRTGLSPSPMCCSKELGSPDPPQRTLLQTTIRRCEATEILKLGLFPVRSPLLGESLLVSLPPLIDMLKFSG